MITTALSVAVVFATCHSLFFAELFHNGTSSRFYSVSHSAASIPELPGRLVVFAASDQCNSTFVCDHFMEV